LRTSRKLPHPPQRPTSAIMSTDRAALVALYNATDGDNWTNNTNWNTDAPLGQWYGTGRVNDQGRVVMLDLRNNNLKGSFTMFT
ncbi:unnamed protein product, partial [Ectocarpus sp. 12 AP-2014]